MTVPLKTSDYTLTTMVDSGSIFWVIKRRGMHFLHFHHGEQDAAKAELKKLRDQEKARWEEEEKECRLWEKEFEEEKILSTTGEYVGAAIWVSFFITIIFYAFFRADTSL